jgi:hypothetical protein
MLWNFSTIADELHAVIERAEADFRLEQAVRGLDSLDEKEIQSLLAAGLDSKFEIAREVHEHALWLEVKVAYQFREGGIRHGGYGAQWRTAVVDDLRKIETESIIKEAGLLLVVFTESSEVLEKDLQLFEDVLVVKEVLAGFRQVRSTRILDRIGHHFCTAALWPTIQR